MGQDFDNDPVVVSHHGFLDGLFGVHLIWLVLAIILTAIIFHLMNANWLEPERRRRKRFAIYTDIAKALKTASEARGMATLGAAQTLLRQVNETLPHTFKLTGGLNGHLGKLKKLLDGEPRKKPTPPPPPSVQPEGELTPAEQAREAAFAGAPTIIIANNTSAASVAAARVGRDRSHHPQAHLHPEERSDPPTTEELARDAQDLIEAFRLWWAEAPLRLAEIEAAQNELA
ncbi:MAG TPA: hypothetical protein VGL66_04535 [Caulobacteraceae bacterium]|jgi:hypothetical protein